MPEGKSAYPADILAAAEETFARFPIDIEEHSAVISAIAKALLAEREACAKLAASYGNDRDWPGETWIAGAISEAILHRGELNHD